MFWDKVSPIYDLFENIYNRRVYNGTGEAVADLIDGSVEVLECACGTGAISKYLAPKCSRLIATDFSDGMLRQARKKLKDNRNVTVEKADITNLQYDDATFDAVVAGNVIHLLTEHEKALAELKRVTKKDGKIIIPTYINMSKSCNQAAAGFLGLLGADFKRQFDMESYQDFFEKQGYSDVKYYVVDGRMPCAIAMIFNE